MDKSRFEISTDGTNIWVNAEKCLGRFGRYGVEVFARDRGGPCFFAGETHTPTNETTSKDWGIFVEKMKELHNIDVPEKWMPPRLKEGIVELAGTAVGRAKMENAKR